MDYTEKTNGWTSADIESICRNAGMNAIKRYYPLKKNWLLKKKTSMNLWKKFQNKLKKILVSKKNIGKKEMIFFILFPYFLRARILNASLSGFIPTSGI